MLVRARRLERLIHDDMRRARQDYERIAAGGKTWEPK
jgi:hypothetical protein